MKPTVISNSNASASTGSGNFQTGGNDTSTPINHEYREQPNGQQQPHFNTQGQQYVPSEPSTTNYGSFGRAQRQQPTQLQHQQEIPSHFQQDFDFEPDVGMDMFPRTRLGRMTHDPFGDFGGTTPDFGFPQFNSLGRRRINPYNDDDFFNRLPSEFRQYIPDSFAQRRAGTGMTGNRNSGPKNVNPQQQHSHSQFYNTMPQSPTKKVCDAAIQTDDPTGRSEVDHSMNTENLYQHGLRNTIDMGVKSPAENEIQSPRSASAPPTEQQQNKHHPFYNQPQQIPVNVPIRQIPPPQQQNQFATQTSPEIPSGGFRTQSPQFQKLYYAPQQTHPQQRQQTPPPQTPGGLNIRTIPIFVEGRSEPIINNKEIPNQNEPPNATHYPSSNSRAFTALKPQTHRPTPLNTQQQPTTHGSSSLPQTPHTVDTINKIQKIQRDVLELMSRVEKFTGTRADKEYVYLDEMLTRNLLKLDNIDTNGKDSIRLARKEAIKCIQASINVLEAKAVENKKAAKNNVDDNKEPVQETPACITPSSVQAAETQQSMSAEEFTKESIPTITNKPADKIIEPIPLPPPENIKFNEVQIEDCPEDDAATNCINEETALTDEHTKRTSSEAK